MKEKEIENKINRTIEQIRSQQNDELLSLKNEVNQLKSQVSLLSQIVSEQRSQINNLIGGIENLKLVCLEPNLNKGILFNLQNEVDLSNGGFKREGYLVSNLINDDLMSYFCNYDCKYMPNKSADDSWILFDFKQRKVDLYSYTIRAISYKMEYEHPKSWKIFGSNDQREWTLLDHRENEERVRGESKICNFSCQNAKHGRPECRFRYIKYHQSECWQAPNINPFTMYFNFFELFGFVFE